MFCVAEYYLWKACKHWCEIQDGKTCSSECKKFSFALLEKNQSSLWKLFPGHNAFLSKNVFWSESANVSLLPNEFERIMNVRKYPSFIWKRLVRNVYCLDISLLKVFGEINILQLQLFLVANILLNTRLARATRDLKEIALPSYHKKLAFSLLRNSN